MMVMMVCMVMMRTLPQFVQGPNLKSRLPATRRGCQDCTHFHSHQVSVFCLLYFIFVFGVNPTKLSGFYPPPRPSGICVLFVMIVVPGFCGRPKTKAGS